MAFLSAAMSENVELKNIRVSLDDFVGNLRRFPFMTLPLTESSTESDKTKSMSELSTEDEI